MLTPPIVKLDANTFLAVSKPAMLEMFGLATWLVTVWVMARFSPWSMKNVPRAAGQPGPGGPAPPPRIAGRRRGNRRLQGLAHGNRPLSAGQAGRRWPPAGTPASGDQRALPGAALRVRRDLGDVAGVDEGRA